MNDRVGERASATVQAAIVVPTAVLLVLLVIQFALVRHAGHVVTAAAQHGAARAQAERGSAGQGTAAAREFAGRVGTRLLQDLEVSTVRDGDRGRLVVRARVVSLLPGLSPTVTGVADGPRERFRSRIER